ncbi:MerR family transcriptional regulator [Sedimenticola selenatireducens]|uniref:Transcriptional regulator n=1 Tax=Sedimenticola selenatireducens TaxID=191960 RepID=A0A2N6CV45_9GAMM|nr:MerR family transcriptional regulator [Sedimenticola selenatireducens]PLX61069.1 MAG: transcriptional regulator [Sedimenticola selenatireducens]
MQEDLSAQGIGRDELLTIGELSKCCDITQRTIHLHEQRGLISSIRRQGSGNRYFAASTIERITKIKQLQAIGLNLEEVASVLDLYMDKDDHGASGKRAALDILRGHLKEVDGKLQDMTRFREDLLRSIVRLEVLLEDSERLNSMHGEID